MKGYSAFFPVCLLCVACASSTPPPESPDSEAAAEASDVESKPRTAKPEPKAEAEAEADEPVAKPKKQATPEPEFTEKMSFDAAIAAVPQGLERLEVDQETLAKPLVDPKVYQPCKPGNAHFRVRVAVWNGKAAGVDVDAPTPKLTECIRDRIFELTWSAKVKSMNNVEYSF